jgi:hypothetical protein
VKNGIGPKNSIVTRGESEFTDKFNPEFRSFFQLPVRLPDNAVLEMGVWDRGTTQDRFIGCAKIDLEERVLHRKFRGGEESLDLKDASKENISHGRIVFKVEILSEEQARRQKPEQLLPAFRDEYELRCVIWNTRNVEFPDSKKSNVDQLITVTSNFEGKYGASQEKATDIAWSTSGNAIWNYRMKWRVHLPARVPRLRFAMWDRNWLTPDEKLGELIYNLKPLFEKASKEKKGTFQGERQWFAFLHPVYDGVVGEIELQFWLYTAVEADKAPVGEAQEEPNKDPYLAPPKRNRPPWAVGSRTLDLFARQKMLVIAICIAIVVLPVLVPIFLSSAKSRIL